MKNVRSILVFSAIGFILAGGAGFWAYTNFFANNTGGYDGDVITLKPVDSLITLNPVKDSLAASKLSLANKNRKQSFTKKELPAENPVALAPQTIQASTVKPASPETIAEIKNLKTEIEALSKNKNSEPDLKAARQKITELEQRVDKLVDKNSDVEKENKELFAMLRQLSAEKKETEQKITTWPAVFKNKTETKTVALPAVNTQASKQNSLTVPVTAKSEPAVPSNTASGTSNSFAALDLRLSAITVTDNKEIETFEAYQVDKLVGSITVRNNNAQNNSGEIIVVVLQPDGKVLQKSTWESGTFQSPEGKKIYTCRLRFDYTKGEAKRLSFALNSASYMKGNYTMQVYCGGVLIGKIIKSLS
jgi:hypothetical protein